MSVKDRFYAHRKPSTQKLKGTYKLYNAMNKYGVDKFYYEILEEGIPIDELDSKEIRYIELYNSYKNGYNSTPGGDGRVINKIKDEERVLKLAMEGASTKVIAEEYNVHPATIQRTLHKLGFRYSDYRTKPEDVLALLDKGMSNDEIADVLNCSVATVSRILDKTNHRRHRVPMQNRSDFDYDALTEDYLNGLPIKELTEKYNISATTFGRIKKQRNIPTRPHQAFFPEQYKHS